MPSVMDTFDLGEVVAFFRTFNKASCLVAVVAAGNHGCLSKELQGLQGAGLQKFESINLKINFSVKACQERNTAEVKLVSGSSVGQMPDWAKDRIGLKQLQ
eukprot:998539-Pelagomonas_calceolata.AAC.2